MLFSLNVLVIFGSVFIFVFESPGDEPVNIISVYQFASVIVRKGEPVASILFQDIFYFS